MRLLAYHPTRLTPRISLVECRRFAIPLSQVFDRWCVEVDARPADPEDVLGERPILGPLLLHGARKPTRGFLVYEDLESLIAFLARSVRSVGVPRIDGVLATESKGKSRDIRKVLASIEDEVPAHRRIGGGFSGATTPFFSASSFAHAARQNLVRVDQGGVTFYLPKLESHLEARLWNDVFCMAQDALGIPRGTIKATVLIETILAAFETEEILYELRDHSAGLNCGRWDYIFSFIKTFRNERNKVFPDRAKVTMTAHFLRSYSQLLVKTCHRREVHAMGGMAAQIPIKESAHANHEAMTKVRQDKEREAGDGHDGTWVAHPGLVPIAKEAFDKAMPQANQIARKRQDVHVTAADLLQVPQGSKTEAGLRQNVAVGIGYLEAWLRGVGCVPLFNLMEDAATAEISRAQVWQWVRFNSRLEDGRPVNAALCRQIVQEEVAKARALRPVGQPDRHDDAAALFLQLIEAPQCPEFLTLPAYAMLEG